jgi:hypothetical protein
MSDPDFDFLIGQMAKVTNQLLEALDEESSYKNSRNLDRSLEEAKKEQVKRRQDLEKKRSQQRAKIFEKF